MKKVTPYLRYLHLPKPASVKSSRKQQTMLTIRSWPPHNHRSWSTFHQCCAGLRPQSCALTISSHKRRPSRGSNWHPARTSSARSVHWRRSWSNKKRRAVTIFTDQPASGMMWSQSAKFKSLPTRHASISNAGSSGTRRSKPRRLQVKISASSATWVSPRSRLSARALGLVPAIKRPILESYKRWTSYLAISTWATPVLRIVSSSA